MQPNQNTLSESAIKALKTLLRLPESATDEEVNARIEMVCAEMAKLESESPVLTLSTSRAAMLTTLCACLFTAPKPISEIERMVMKQLGIAEVRWIGHDPDLATLSALMCAAPFNSGLLTLDSPAKLRPSGAMPTRLVLMKWGENQTAEGLMIVGLKTLQASKLWDGIGYGDVAIDFNHNTVPGHPSYKGEPAPIAAMATPRVFMGEGLVLENIRWTPEGIVNREYYPDLSPAIKVDESGEVIFIHSAALARNGAVKDLHLFSAREIAAYRFSKDEQEVMRLLNISPVAWIKDSLR